MSLNLNPIEKLKEAREYAEGNTEAEFLLVRERNGSPQVGKLPIGKTVQQEIADNFAQDLTTHIDNLREGDTRTRPLDVANTISEESILQCAPVSDLPNSELFRILISRDNHGSTTYTEDPKPDFQLIRISEPDGKILVGVQSYSGVKLVDTTKKLSLQYSGKEYERFKGDMLVIKPGVNAVYYDGWLFVISPKSFESMFNMREEYEKRAKEAIDGFEDAGIRFTDKEKTTDWLLGHINMLRGMYEIYDAGIHQQATPSQIETMIKNYDLDQRFSLSYVRQNGEIELDVAEYVHTWKLLKLLSGKYAEDNIMGTQWEIDSGQRL
ncbi:Kiwa anti-phage protein KwaB-like domain-containing protein [Natrinema soli]|uniref:Kiwa anti-phage protein KwaB-like domain-containing protein n=1 Tax=Natrinema soli TaxID=1930624 RepID=A0ABD5SQ44_9EURY|nr:Kiwa anti-phage protein KwaB-like domain-containing protein [Natrinema soli]